MTRDPRLEISKWSAKSEFEAGWEDLPENGELPELVIANVSIDKRAHMQRASLEFL